MLPVPQTPVLDNFNRADNASLGASYTVDPFHEFDVPTTSPQILTNAARAVAGASTGYSLVWKNDATYGPDMESYCTIASNGATGSSPILLNRIQNPSASVDTGAGYVAEWEYPNTIRIIKYTAGNNTDVELGSATSPISIGVSFVFQSKGSRHTVYRNGVAVLQVVDSSITGTGAIGFGYYDDAAKAGSIDNFGGGTISNATYLPQLQRFRRRRRRK